MNKHVFSESAPAESEVEKELALLSRRWGKNIEVLGVQYEGDVGNAACFKLNLPPSDPDFPVCICCLV